MRLKMKQRDGASILIHFSILFYTFELFFVGCQGGKLHGC